MGSLGTSSATAQSIIAPVINRCPEVGDASAIVKSNKKYDLVETAGLKAGTTASENLAAGVSSTSNLREIQQPAKAALGALSANKSISLLDEHKLSVKVLYDPRPVGGILTVRVSMNPSFRGIGVSTRPATSRSVALAVDEFSQELVDKMVTELTEDITAEFRSMQEAKEPREASNSGENTLGQSQVNALAN